MKRNILLMLLALICVSAQAQGVFDYDQWVKEHSAQKTQEPKETVRRKTNVSPFASAYFETGSVKGFGASAGINLWGAEIEANYLKGLVESYQVQRHFGAEQHSYTYTPQVLGATFGYELRPWEIVSVTPKVGVNYLIVNGLQANESTVRNKETAHATTLTLGLQINVHLMQHLDFYITPQYVAKRMQNDELYDILFVNKDIRDWSRGTSVKIGLRLAL